MTMTCFGVKFPAMLCFLVVAASCKPAGDRSEVAATSRGEDGFPDIFVDPDPSFIQYVSQALNNKVISKVDLTNTATGLSSPDSTLQSFALNSRKVQHAICLSSNLVVTDKGFEIGLCKRVNAPGFVDVQFGDFVNLETVKRGLSGGTNLSWLRWLPENDDFSLYANCKGFDAAVMGGISHIQCVNKDKDSTWAKMGGAMWGLGWSGSAGKKDKNGELAYFHSSSKNMQDGIEKRFKSELNDALSRLNN
jgi:hypothetical protein